MAYTTINKSTEHFDTKVYTGNGSSQTLDMRSEEHTSELQSR